MDYFWEVKIHDTEEWSMFDGNYGKRWLTPLQYHFKFLDNITTNYRTSCLSGDLARIFKKSASQICFDYRMVKVSLKYHIFDFNSMNTDTAMLHNISSCSY